MDALVLENVTKSFGALCAVDSLSARISEGTIYGFLGPNGAGKTTTLRMIMNIILPDSGRLEILGASSESDVRDRIGYMPEERGLYRKMKVSALLQYLGSLKGTKKNELKESIPRWLDRVDLSGFARKRVEELSRGMQQKLQFVATVLHNPDLLILDKPFSGLDPVNLELLKEIILTMKNEGKTVIFSTHMMEQAEKLCDRILLINKGKSVIDNSLEEIRAEFPSDKIVVAIEGDSGFINSLPFVERVTATDRKFEITLREGADAQELLRALVGKVFVRSFEVKVPSLHEIFIHLVRSTDAKDS